MELADVAAKLALIAGVLLSLGVIWKCVKTFVTRTREIGEICESVRALPDWMEKVNTDLKQLHPNGGSSMRDELGQIKELLAELVSEAPVDR